MSIANVNIGAAANDGTGDPLRSAFRKINQNFANLEALTGNANVTYNPGVESVAGRTGNVVLSVSDVIGAASIGYVNTVAANLSNAALALSETLTTVTWANVTGKPSFATIATSGSWNNLSNIPVNVAGAVTQTEINSAVAVVNANVTAANARIGQLQANVTALYSNAASQQTEMSGLRANITAANAAIVAINLNSINANVTAVNAAITALTLANVNQGSYIEQNTNRVAAANIEIGKLRANITAANTAIADLIAELSGAFGNVENIIIAGNANVDAANAAITALSLSTTANAIAQDSLIGSLTANAAIQHNEINSLRANVTAANAAIGIINANIGAFQIFSNANAVTQRTQIVNLQEDVNLNNSRIATLITGNLAQQTQINKSITDIIYANLVLANHEDRISDTEANVANDLRFFNNLRIAEIESLQSNGAAYEEQISSLFANAVTQNNEIILVNSNVLGVSSRVDDLYSNIVLRIGDIAALTSNAATQADILTALDSNAAVQNVEIKSLESNIGNLASSVFGFNGRMSTIEYLYSIVDGNIDDLYATTGTVENEVIDLRANINAANAAIIATEGSLTLLINDLFANAASQANDMTGANTEISSTNSNVGLINNTISILDANVGVLNNLLAVGNANITAANATISTLTVNVQILESNVSFTQIDITNLQAKFDNGNLIYTPNNATHWNGTISNVAAALDQLASRIWAIENP